MSLDSYDFDRAEPTRAAMRAAAVAGQPADIAAALQRPDVPDELLARPFQVVTDLSALRGAGAGRVPVPEELADPVLAGDIDVDDPDRCCLFYRGVLLHGSSTLQADVLNRARLVQLWPGLAGDLPAAVVQVWQQRFAELADR
ncbi:hypothetical protein ACFU7X_37355 [Streptomyces chartreusis]|uniref:hypothetical protein n=1 Tax=Streptomyces chartreusis TaxID=1969 RepID=UPI00368ECDCE